MMHRYFKMGNDHVVSYPILYLLFVKSVSLPYPSHIPIVSMPYPGIID